jgi:Fe-S cluster assembly iron-binding protein IscA
MVTVTRYASIAIQSLMDATRTPPGGGLRIAGTDGAGLRVTVSPGPLPGDTVVDADGAVVFLDTSAAAELEGRALNIKVDPDGAVRFTIAALARPASA